MAAIILKDTEITSSNLTINSSFGQQLHFGSNNSGKHLFFGALGHNYESETGGAASNNYILHGNLRSSGILQKLSTNVSGDGIGHVIARRLVHVQEITVDTDISTTSITEVRMSDVITYTPLYNDSTIVIDTESNVFTSNTGTDDDFLSRYNFACHTTSAGASVLTRASPSAILCGASNYDPDSMIIFQRITFNMTGARASDGNVYMALRGNCSTDTSAGWAMSTTQYYTTVTIQEYV